MSAALYYSDAFTSALRWAILILVGSFALLMLAGVAWDRWREHHGRRPFTEQHSGVSVVDVPHDWEHEKDWIG